VNFWSSPPDSVSPTHFRLFLSNASPANSVALELEVVPSLARLSYFPFPVQGVMLLLLPLLLCLMTPACQLGRPSRRAALFTSVFNFQFRPFDTVGSWRESLYTPLRTGVYVFFFPLWVRDLPLFFRILSIDSPPPVELIIANFRLFEKARCQSPFAPFLGSPLRVRFFPLSVYGYPSQPLAGPTLPLPPSSTARLLSSDAATSPPIHSFPFPLRWTSISFGRVFV